MAEMKASVEKRKFNRCGGCSEEIRDKFLLKALDRLWHVYCLRCCDCGEALEGKCFFREGNIFCETDYYRRQGKLCCICQKVIPPRQQVRRLLDRVYHITCLACVICKRQLATGDLCYLLQEGGVVCKHDYDENKSSGDSDQSSPSENSVKGKRARTFITVQQLKVLKSVYLQSPRPDLAERIRISKATGLDLRVVQVWFQNRRAKQKRLENKGKNPWANQICHLPVARNRSRSFPSPLNLSYSVPRSSTSPTGENNLDSAILEDDVFGRPVDAHNTFSRGSQGEDSLRQQTTGFGIRPSVAFRQVSSAPVSPAVPDVTGDTAFPFPSYPSSFPPLKEMIDLCEEELRFLEEKQPPYTPSSPTNSFYEADSESGVSNINTPCEERHFFFDGPVTLSPCQANSNQMQFTFDPVVINSLTQESTFY